MGRGRFKTSTTLEDIERSVRANIQAPASKRRRRSGRVRPESVRCNLGKVLDLSASGVRVRSRRQLRGQQICVLIDGEFSAKVHAAVVWSKKLGFMSHEVGLNFIKVSREDAVVIQSMAVFC